MSGAVGSKPSLQRSGVPAKRAFWISRAAEMRSRITAEPGDVILYQGNRIVLFYGNNTWSYTRIGKISGYSAEELRTLLGGGKGDLPVRLSLL